MYIGISAGRVCVLTGQTRHERVSHGGLAAQIGSVLLGSQRREGVYVVGNGGETRGRVIKWEPEA